MSLIVRSRGKCELAGLDDINCGGNLQHMHIITRGNNRLRYEELNALCGCVGHHYYYTNHPWDFVKFVEEHFPESAKFIEEHRNEYCKRILDDYLSLETQLKNRLESVNDTTH